MKTNLPPSYRLYILLAFFLFSIKGWGQIYKHDFGTTSITEIPYTANPPIFDSHLSNSSWTTSATGFAGYPGNGGAPSQSLSLSNSSGTPTITLTFDVEAGYKMSISQFNFWRIGTATGAQNWSMTINGIAVGSGPIPTTGAAIGNTTVSNTVNNLTGTITVVLSLSGATGTGTFRLDDFTLIGSVTPVGPASIKSGDWNDASTWSTNSVPADSDNVTISAGDNVYTSASLNRTGDTFVNGIFELRSGGFASGTGVFKYDNSAGTLNFNLSSGSYGVGNNHIYWPTVNGPFNVNVLNNGLDLQSGTNRSINGTFSLANSGSSNVSIASGSELRINGICRIDAGGAFGSAPIFGASSALHYNSAGTYARGLEWIYNGVGTIGITPGYPNNVQLKNNTVLNYRNGGAASKAIAGNLTIDLGSALYMNYGGSPSGGPLVVKGDILNNGTLGLGDGLGDDLKLEGNFTNTGTFDGKQRAVFFTKNGVQTITSSSLLTIPYIVLAPAIGSTTVQLTSGTNLDITAPAGGNAVSFTNATDIIDINGQSLTIGTIGQSNVISGNGSFKGSATSNLTLIGNGSIGTLNITGGLNNFTVNRQPNGIAAVLGTNLTVNGELKLSNGILDVNNTQLTSAATGTITNASASNYIIADRTIGGSLKKSITSLGSYTFPIGDAASSADGSQYSPATVNLTAANLSGAYLVLNVDDSKEPNNEAPTDYISRYWNLNGAGVTSATYNFTANYLPADINGTENNSISGRYASGSWTEGDALAANTLNITGLTTGSGAISLIADSNHFSAGSPLKKPNINIKGNGTTIPAGSTTVSIGNNTDFGSVISGVNASKIFVIENTVANSKLILGNPAVLLTDGAQGFSVSAQPAINPMTGNTSQNFTILFNKSLPGIYTDIVKVYSSDLDTPIYTFKIQATVSQPAITVDKTSMTGFTYAFGQGPSATQNFIVNGVNLGSDITVSASANWEISTNQTYDGANTSPWSTIVLTKTIAGTVTNKKIQVRLKEGLAVGTYAGTITLTSSNATTQTITLSGVVTAGLRDIKVTGNGTSITNGSVTTLGLNNTLFASQNLGNSQTKTFEIKNLGGSPLTLGSITLSGVDASSFSVLNAPLVGTLLTQNQTATFEVKFAPTTIGTKNATVNIVNDDPNDNPYTFAIKGGATYCSSAGELIIARQDFELTPATPVLNYTLTNFGAILPGPNTGFSSGKSLSSDAPKTNNLYSEGARGYRIQGADPDSQIPSGVIFTFNNVDTSAYTNISLSFKVAGFSLGSSSNGMDDWDATNTSTAINANKVDFVLVEISPDNGVNWYTQAKVVSDEPDLSWSFGSDKTLEGSRTYVADNNLTYFNSTSAARYSAISINDLPAVPNLKVRISAQDNALNESWILDDVRITSTGLVPKIWNGSVWLPSVPQPSDKAIINADYNSSINGGFQVCQCEISGAATLTVAPANEVKVADFLVNNGKVIVEPNGNFTQVNETDTNYGSGNFKVLQNLPLSTERKQYNYLISPTLNTNLKDIYKDAGGNPVEVPAVLYHREATNFFYTSAGDYIKGRALAVKEAATSFAPGIMTATFVGKPANGAFTYNLVNSNPADPNNDRGYNLIGNPYPSNIDLIKFYSDNAATGNLSPTFYFWDNKANTQVSQMGDLYLGQAYAQFNAATPPGIGTPTKALGDPGSAGVTLPTRYVKIAQGFMTKVINAASFTVTFSNSIRKAETAEGFFGKGKETEPSTSVDRYWLNMITPVNKASNIAVVYFQEGDNAFTKDDSRDMGGSDAIYSLVDGEKVSINGKSDFTDTDVVSLGTSHFASGNYTIALDKAEGIFANGQNIYLKDNQSGILTNLSAGSYSFNAAAGETASRFEIIYKPETILTTDVSTAEELIVYKDGGDFVLKSQTKKITDLEVYDANGRLLLKLQPNQTKAVIPAEKLVNGVYILKITQSGKITTKKIIK